MPPNRSKRGPKPPAPRGARRRANPRPPRPIPIASSEVELLDEVASRPEAQPSFEVERPAVRAPGGATAAPEKETNILSLPPPVPEPHDTTVTATMPPLQTLAHLFIDQGPGAGRAIPVIEGELIVGRSSSAGLQLNHPSVSRQHLVVRRAGDRFFVRDCGSHNGTYLNGRALHGEVEFFSGDELALGRVVLVLRCGAPMVTGRTVIPAPLERTHIRIAIFAGAALLGVALVLLFARVLSPAPASAPVADSTELPAASPPAPELASEPPAPEPGESRRKEAVPPAAATAPAGPSAPERVAAGDLTHLANGEISATRMLQESRRKASRTTVRKREERPKTSKRRAPSYDKAALETYLTGDLDGAIAAAERAGDDALRRKLRELEAAIASARADADFGDDESARRHYDRAIALDRQIAGGKGKLAQQLKAGARGVRSRAGGSASTSAADAAFGD